ncbi:hypothetical protein CTEN210_02908 [Chaetoceros tenuissimus]|uniref:Uncharacterized protein n=1 Tax=Chaetoceros tenuissimus TaxID=426638 RepID=A0AAD3CIT7_9STRA|nr:hypothetical protein CTEN210_02908 [Chaetoceros tenuissimus]
MKSLTQEIMELQTQLQLIQDVKEEWKDEKCIKQIAEAVKNTKTNLSKAFGESLHRLHVFQPKESVIRKVLQEFPESMKVKNQVDRIPIQSCFVKASKGKSLKYIPVLAKEGSKHEVGGADGRGGLLTTIPRISSARNTRRNTLQFLPSLPGDEYDRLALNTMKELKKLGLLKKDDIKEYNLTLYSVGTGKDAPLRLRSLLEWDHAYPLERITYKGTSTMFMHWVILWHTELENVKAVLTVTFNMYPEEAGFLFQRNENGKTALEYALEKFGEKETMTMLHEILSPTKSFPILHHALVHVPQKATIFTKWFPWAFHLRDRHGRSLHQAIMAAGGKCIEENNIVIASMSDDQVQEKDPITTLYPFAAVASGEDGDLERSFELLRRQPGVLDRSPVQRKRTKKRKRSSTK